jgi:hypothetical protein
VSCNFQSMENFHPKRPFQSHNWTECHPFCETCQLKFWSVNFAFKAEWDSFDETLNIPWNYWLKEHFRREKIGRAHVWTPVTW